MKIQGSWQSAKYIVDKKKRQKKKFAQELFFIFWSVSWLGQYMPTQLSHIPLKLGYATWLGLVKKKKTL